ncbi:MAG TPA: hypothetical protein VKT73_07900 [Xanthobacteraceae bacterium]|nr:hypothetical protein [Xanthobacteraceae bacterium]
MHDNMSGGALIIGLIFWFVILGIPLMQILRRTGFSRAWVLIMFVPIVNIVFLWIYAFTRWPVEGE